MKSIKTITGILILTLALASQVRAQTFLTNGLVAYYPLNGNANDQSGNGNNGVITVAVPATNHYGISGNAYLFNDQNSVITVPSLASTSLTALTVSVWVQVTAGGTVIDKWRGYSYSLEDYFVGVGSDLTVTLSNGRHGNGYNALPNHCGITTTNHLALGVWYQIVATLDSSGNGTVWVNGSLWGQDNILPLLPPATEPLRFGQALYTASAPYYGAVDSSFGGVIDDVRIYNRALSASEVQQLYAYESVCIPHRATAIAQTTNGFVVGATITDGGCGYTNTPLVLIQGGGGTGATATAVMSGGMVTGITMTGAGTGYTSTPAIYIYAPFPFQTGLVKSVRPSFADLLTGTNYQLQVSGDLNNWTNQGAPFTAAGPTLVYPQYFDVANWNQLYFRLQVAP